jgi:chitodextrinase
MRRARVGWLRRALLSAFGALLASTVTPAPAHARTPRVYIQKRYFQVIAGSSVTVTLRRATTPGNLLVAYVVWDNGGSVSLTDSLGNAYQTAAGPTQAAGDPSSAQMFYAANIAGGVDTMTATFATPITVRGDLYVVEYAGMDRIAPLETAVVATGSSLAIDTGPLTTAHANDLLVLGVESNGRSVRKPKGYKSRARRWGNMLADLSAPTVGSYEALATQRGTAWVTQFVAFKPSGSTHPTTNYPLAVSANGRYLVDRNAQPFLIAGDSPQALMVNLSESEADGFFADRQAAGFNLVWVNLLCATYTGGRVDGSTYDGIVPFTTPNDLSTPNESYFARVDDMLNLAAQHGLVVLLDPAETGSFLSVLKANGVTKSRDYGRYLGTRYRDFDNIVWMSGNDFQTWPDAGDDAVVEAVAQGIHDTDDRHIHTVELDYEVSGSLDDPTWAPLIELNASYTYFPTYAQVLTDYDRPNAIPTFLVEANYEFEHNAADLGTPAILRRQAYWALLSGATGQLYGNHYTWPFVDGWQSNLDTPGSLQMGYVSFLFAARRWYDLVPDQSHTLVTAGFGTYADSGALGDNDYLTAARTADGALAMAYMPTVRTITVDMSTLAMPAYAAWYDPTIGTFAAIAGSPLPNGGTHDFTPPAQNAAGDGDWVLVLESAPPDVTPPHAPTGLVAANVTASGLTLSWAAATDDVGVAGYRVYRDGVLLRSTAATTTTDAGLAALTQYSYTVVAYDYANNPSAPSTPLVVTTASPGPTLVQTSYATPQTPQTIVGATYASDQTAGNANIVAIGWNDTTASVTSVADAAGNVYHVAVPTFRGNGLSQTIYYAANVVAASGGTNQVTVTFDQAAAFVDLRVTEYAGLRQTNPFHVGRSGTGNGSTADSGTVTTSTPSELLFAAGMTATTFSAPGSGFTSELVTTPDGDLVEDAVAGAPDSYGATASLGAGTWLMQLATFTPAP